MASTMITKLSKNKILKARAGIKALPVVIQTAFGNSADGTSSEDDNTLKNELSREDLSSIEQVTDTNFRYTRTLFREELTNMFVNEMVLCDAEGDLVMVRICSDKNKNGDEEMTFAFDDIFQEAEKTANFEINEEQAALIWELRKLETSDPVHANVYNALFGKLTSNDTFLEQLTNKMIEKSMLCHVLDSVNTQQVPAADVGPKITKITDGLRKSISGLNTDLSNRSTSRVTDCSFLTEGKSETVAMAIWDNNTLNTLHKQGVSGFGNGFIIGMSLEPVWAIQVVFAVLDTNLFARSYTFAEIGWIGW